MTDDLPPRQRRPRLDAGARSRLLEELARIDAAEAAAAPATAITDPESSAPSDSIPHDTATHDTAPRAHHPPAIPADPWGNMLTFPVNESLLARNLVITAARSDPAHAAFDVLRTRLIHALSDNGWKRIGITSPTQGCGKSFVAANLAITFSRYERFRTVLLDMDLRRPMLAKTFGIDAAPAMGDFLRGQMSTADFLMKPGQNLLNIGPSLAIGVNGRVEPFAAELFHNELTARTLNRLDAEVHPDVLIYDMPPVLAQDDVIAFHPYYDCVLMVSGGGLTTAREMKEAARRLGNDRPIIGVVLNRGEGEGVDDYSY